MKPHSVSQQRLACPPCIPGKRCAAAVIETIRRGVGRAGTIRGRIGMHTVGVDQAVEAVRPQVNWSVAAMLTPSSAGFHDGPGSALPTANPAETIGVVWLRRE